MSRRFRFILTAFCSALVVAVGAFVLTQTALMKWQERAAFEIVHAQAGSVKIQMQDALDGLRRDVEQLAARPAMLENMQALQAQDGNNDVARLPTGLSPELRRIQDELVFAHSVVLAEKSDDSGYAYVAGAGGGMLTVPDEPLGENYDPRQRPWYQKAVQQGMAVAEYFISADDGAWICSMAAPVLVNGKALGVVGLDKDMTPMLDDIIGTLGPGFNVLIFDEEGGPIALHKGLNGRQLPRDVQEDLSKQLRGSSILSRHEEVIARENLAGLPYLLQTIPLAGGWKIVLLQDLRGEPFMMRPKDVLVLAFLAGVLAAILVSLGYLAAGASGRPTAPFVSSAPAASVAPTRSAMSAISAESFASSASGVPPGAARAPLTPEELRELSSIARRLADLMESLLLRK